MAEAVAIARPYAQAAFETAHAAEQLAQWSDALHAAALVVADSQVAALISAPGSNADQLVTLISEIALQQSGGASGPEFGNLIRLLAENKRLHALPEIAAGFDVLKADTENRVQVTLTAASPVDEEQQARIMDALKKRFGRDVSLTFELDKSLIGGARLSADDLVIDGSIRSGLDKLASALSN